jgi:hypothetical protein
VTYRLSLPLLLALALAACDAGIGGDPASNLPPTTSLSVADSSLVDNLDESRRLASTVELSWTGTDPDGYVEAFELRIVSSDGTPQTDWSRTTATDTLLRLPIPRGATTADVGVEVRAVDNEGLADPTPASTIYPVRNSPPTAQLDGFELPPDTTWDVVSFAFAADDPEGEDNLARIEIALNDSTAPVALPPGTRYVTLVGPDEALTDQTVDARVYTGRGFNRTDVTLPGLRLDADNVFYVRAVDQTDTTSAWQRFPAAGSADEWYVKGRTSEVLLVNDFRKDTAPTVLDYHLGLLREQVGEAVDVWNINEPFTTGSSGNSARSPLIGPSQEPALLQTFARWKHIYWVSTAATNSASRNTLPYAAPALDLFFQGGGTMMTHVPVTLPTTADLEDNADNAALFLLPITDLVPTPDSVRSLSVSTGAPIVPANALPGASQELPQLEAQTFVITSQPYLAQGDRTLSLYRAEWTYRLRQGRTSGVWSGPSDVASLRLDASGRPVVGLWSLPVVNEQTGEPLLGSPSGDPDALRRALLAMLESLDF